MLGLSAFVYADAQSYETARADPFPDTVDDGAEEVSFPGHTETGAELASTPSASNEPSSTASTTVDTAQMVPGSWLSVAAMRVLDGADPAKDLVATDRSIEGPQLQLEWQPGENSRVTARATTPKYMLPQIPRIAFVVPDSPMFVSAPGGQPDSSSPYCVLMGADPYSPSLTVQELPAAIPAEQIEHPAYFGRSATYFECPTDPGSYGIDLDDPPTLAVSVTFEYSDLKVAESEHPSYVSQHFFFDEHPAQVLLDQAHPASGSDYETFPQSAFGWSEMSDGSVSVIVSPQNGPGAVHSIFPSADEITTSGYVLDDRVQDGHLRLLARWRALDVQDRSGWVQMSLLTAGAGLSILVEAMMNSVGKGRFQVFLFAALSATCAVLAVSGSRILSGAAGFLGVFALCWLYALLVQRTGDGDQGSD